MGRVRFGGPVERALVGGGCGWAFVGVRAWGRVRFGRPIEQILIDDDCGWAFVEIHAKGRVRFGWSRVAVHQADRSVPLDRWY